MRPLCVICLREMLPKKNDYRVMIRGEIWSGDLYACPSCLNEIVTGWGRRPIADAIDTPHWIADLVVPK